MTGNFPDPHPLASVAGPAYLTEAEPRDIAGEVVLVAALSSPADHLSLPVDDLVIVSQEAGPAAAWLFGAEEEEEGGTAATG
jgi:hypothetical protein